MGEDVNEFQALAVLETFDRGGKGKLNLNDFAKLVQELRGFRQKQQQVSTEEDAFVRVPRGLEEGDKFHFFRDGRPFELIVPVGAGGDAVIRLPKSDLAPPEGYVPPPSEDFGRED